MIICGAGLGGLIAATQFRQAAIFEKAECPTEVHRALLRFRSDAVAKATGIDFKKVRVHKGIVDFGKASISTVATIRDMNDYSQKVTGKVAPRSIGDLAPVDRYIAPLDFYGQLLDQAMPRIHWGVNVTSPREFTGECPVISTLPMEVFAPYVGAKDIEFSRAPIHVMRFDLRDVEVYQTVYIPSPQTSIYRLSITGSTVIVEGTDQPTFSEASYILAAMGIAASGRMVGSPVHSNQRYGKISPIDDEQRKAIIIRLTADHNIYSLGRFATWRNILLDDYIKDIEQIRHMMRYGSYHQHLRRK